MIVDVPHPVHMPDSMGQFLVHVLEVHTLTMVEMDGLLYGLLLVVVAMKSEE